ncbi:putative transcription regulator containing HTH domain [Pseudomonas asplenii]|uniref:Putative transcription regulator containing HTH domain n=1 Tax=Pseudomonas asplenii TaxID=53407 RepID=A0A0N0VL66_9PSED|nr:transcriptional regulator [Pseudomonas fuscovaginae]KPA93297.1 putative transcription regulator containing HTH domain [Pseudomonas fuscovaginae]
MGFAAIKEKAHALFSEAGFISRIANDDDYAKALALMDDLLEDYEVNRPLIEILARSIESWENESEEFVAFNARVAKLGGVDVLRLLMEQHGLGVADLPEIGSKSLVCKILNGRGRNLTRDHIAALSKRFAVSPALFF